MNLKNNSDDVIEYYNKFLKKDIEKVFDKLFDTFNNDQGLIEIVAGRSETKPKELKLLENHNKEINLVRNLELKDDYKYNSFHNSFTLKSINNIKTLNNLNDSNIEAIDINTENSELMNEIIEEKIVEQNKDDDEEKFDKNYVFERLANLLLEK